VTDRHACRGFLAVYSHPCPPDMWTKQLSLPHSFVEKGSSELNWLFTVLPALSITFTFQDELARISSIIFASCYKLIY
jgi:hypothetical protein